MGFRTKYFNVAGTKLLWSCVLINCVAGGMTFFFHQVILNVMEDCILDYLEVALKKTHGLTVDDDTLSYIYRYDIRV